MFRVTKINKYFAFITFGSPEMRLELFMESLQPLSYELSCHKVSLSLLSNFVNSLRSNSSDFSIKSALKDKNVLYSSFLEGKKYILMKKSLFESIGI